MIQEKDFLYRVPVKTAPITTPKGQIRNPEILVDLEGGEFMHGNILDANSTNKLINQSVKEAVDNKIIEGGHVTKDLLDAETSARTNGDEDLSAKIKAEQTRAEGKEKEISDKLAIVDGDSNTEGSFRKAIADVIAAAPEDLDTLKEIADKLADSDDLHTALNQAITEKADASALANEVTRATGAESNLQAAIDAKQDAGNYIPYDSTDTSNYNVDRTIKVSGENGYTTLDNGHLGMLNENGSYLHLQCEGIRANDRGGSFEINTKGISIEDGKTGFAINYVDGFYINTIGRNLLAVNKDYIALNDMGDDNGYALRIDPNGINFAGKTSNDIPTANGSFININDYALKSEITNQIATKADTTALTALQQKVTANTTAITNVTTSKGIPYDPSVENVYSTDKDLAVKIDDQSTAVFSPTSCISLKNAGINALSLTYGGLQCKVGDQNKIDINPNTINQVTSAGYVLSIDPSKIKQVAGNYTFDVNSTDCIKWSTTDGTVYSKIDMYGFDSKIGSDSYTKCGSATGLDIKGYGPYNGTQTTLNPNQLLMKKSDDRQVMLTPEQLLMKSGDSQVMLRPDRILVQKEGVDSILDWNQTHLRLGPNNRNVKIGPTILSNGGAGILIDEGYIVATYLQSGRLLLAGSSGFSTEYCYDKIQGSGSIISFTENSIRGFEIETPGIPGTLSETITDIRSTKQDKITVNSVDVTDIETDDIAKLRTIVKDLIDALSESGLIRKNINVE